MSTPTTRRLLVVFAMFSVVAAALFLSRRDDPTHLGRIHRGRTLPVWFNQLRGDSGDPVKETLREIGPEAVIYLHGRLKLRDSFLRSNYLKLWPKLPAFLKARLRQPNSVLSTRIKAISALRQMGPPHTQSESGLAALIEGLRDPTEEVRSRAEGAVGDVGAGAKAALPALMDSVKRQGASINGIWALGQIGPDARAAIPLLEKISRETTGRKRTYAADALWRITPGHPIAVPTLANALEDANPHARREAAEALQRIGAAARPAMPSLMTALQDSDATVRICAARALIEVAPTSAEGIDVLKEALSRPVPHPYDLMDAESLLKVETNSMEAIRFLRRLLADEGVRGLSAAEALARIGRESETSVPFLVRCLKSPDPSLRKRAAIVLGQIGVKAQSAIIALQEASRDQNAGVGTAAAEALRQTLKISPPPMSLNR